MVTQAIANRGSFKSSCSSCAFPPKQCLNVIRQPGTKVRSMTNAVTGIPDKRINFWATIVPEMQSSALVSTNIGKYSMLLGHRQGGNLSKV